MFEIIERIPIKDTTINSGMIYENYGDYYGLFIGKYRSDSIYSSLMQFELPPLRMQGMIHKAELLLYIFRNDEPAAYKEFEIYRITENFDETKVSYENKPHFDNKVYSSFSIQNEINTYISIDITKLFSDWYCEKYPNKGLMIRAADEEKEGLIGFYSKDTFETPYMPKLQITFEYNAQMEKMNTDRYLEDEDLFHEKYYYLGNAFYEKGDYDQAYDGYKKYLEIPIYGEKHIAKSFFRMAITAEKLGKDKEAQKIIEQGLQEYPKFTDLVFLMGNLLYKQGKILLAIKAFHRCMDMGEAPLDISFIHGVASYRSMYALAQSCYELKDYEEAYNYGVRALCANSQYRDPLYLVAKILIDRKRDLADVQLKLEDFLGFNLEQKDYERLGDIFFRQGKYITAYNYFSKAEAFMKNAYTLCYQKGMCQLYLKEYHQAYISFKEIKEGPFYDDGVYKRALCKILTYHMTEAEQMLNLLRNPENNRKRKVYYTLKEILEEKELAVISDDREASADYSEIIFDLLDILIKAGSPEIFEKSLQLLNQIEDDEALLKLAKLYYANGFYKLAYNEFIRS
ncbi:MAG: DNRLRE domain-containing protein, partial [Thermotaleaceae bacterium]